MALKERSVTILTASFALGAYVAFCPFICCHTLIIILLAWLFPLNWFVMLAVSNVINNPWTMIPVYSSGYFTGEWLLGGLCGIDTQSCNPLWVQSLNDTLYHYTGLHGVAFWSFMVGGNLLGLLLAAMLYPTMKPIFTRLLQKVNSPKSV